MDKGAKTVSTEEGKFVSSSQKKTQKETRK